MALHIIFSAIFLLAPVIQSEICQPIDYDISTLTSVPFWWLEVDPSYCAATNGLSASSKTASDGLDVANTTNGTIINSKSNCMIIFSVCKELPILCPDQGVCMVKGLNSSFDYITWPVNLGSMEYEGFKFGTANKYLSIEYHNGGKSSCKSGGTQQSLRTRITFNCEKNTKWNATAKKDAPFAGGAKAPPASIMFNLLDCMYYITFNSSEGCPNFGPGGTEGHSLSVGSILLILFFPSIFLYCVIGGMINAGRNKSGTQLIPNYDFWKDLPYLILDGFGFVIGILTCNKVTTTGGSTPNYQSM